MQLGHLSGSPWPYQSVCQESIDRQELIRLQICTFFCTIYRMSDSGHTIRVPATAAVSDVRERLSEIVEEVSATGSDMVITKHGRPTAVLLGFDDYESLIETVNVLSDEALMAAIAEAEREVAAGELEPLD